MTSNKLHVIRLDDETYKKFFKYHLSLQIEHSKRLQHTYSVNNILEENKALKSEIKKLKKSKK